MYALTASTLLCLQASHDLLNVECTCRGSLEVGDVLSDLKAEPMDIHLLGRHGKVHEGIMSAATYVHCNTAGALQQAAHEHPGTPLLITGHSMGGEARAGQG